MSSSAHQISYTVLVLGAGVLLGAIGVYLYESLAKKNKSDRLKQSLEELRKEQKSTTLLKQNTVASCSSLDGDEDEFFDISNSEEDLKLNVCKSNTEDLDLGFEYIDSVLKDLKGDKIKALDALLELYEQDNENCQILWRLAQTCYQISLQTEGKTKREYVNKGIKYANKSLAIDSTIPGVHKWYAICVGARAEWQGTDDKIKDGMEFQKHVLKALEISPNDSTLYHLLGRFQYEVAGLSWFQRKAAETIYGSIPSSTFTEAISSLTKANELALHPWKENNLFIAKCYIELGADTIALEWLDKAHMIPATTVEENKIEEEIQTLIRKYQSW